MENQEELDKPLTWLESAMVVFSLMQDELLRKRMFNEEEIRIIGDALQFQREYKDLEEQGLLVRLPCKVGDVVYEVDSPQYGVIECKVIGCTVMNDISFLVSVSHGHGKGSGYEFSERDIGSSVFLTREEAKKRIVELEGSKDE